MRRCCSSASGTSRVYHIEQKSAEVVNTPQPVLSEDTQAEGTYRRAISLSRSSGNSATGGRSHPLFILRTNQIGGSSLAGIESPRSAIHGCGFPWRKRAFSSVFLLSLRERCATRRRLLK